MKRLKADLQANRQLESELRSQLSSLSSQDRSLRSELGQLRQDNELLQNKWVHVVHLNSDNNLILLFPSQYVEVSSWLVKDCAVSVGFHI